MCTGVIIPIWRVFGFGVVYWGAAAAGAGTGAAAGAGWGTWPPFALGPPFLFNSLSLFRVVKQLLELFLQRLGALVPEVSRLLTVVTTVISPFGVISHSDGSRIDLSVESHLYVVPVLRGVIIIDVRRNVILLGLNLHGGFHLCSMDGDVGTVVVVLLVITCLILMIVIRPLLVWICIVGSVRRLARGWGVCLGILCPSTPAVLSLILLTYMHSDK